LNTAAGISGTYHNYVFEGCTSELTFTDIAFLRVDLTVGNIQNPYAKRQTAAITIELATDLAFTKVVAQTDATMTLPASALAVGAINLHAGLTSAVLVAKSGTQTVVQEDVGSMELKFATTSKIPGTADPQVPGASTYR
jgi:hypothetical protein